MPSALLAAAKGQNPLQCEFQLFKLREYKQLNCIDKLACYNSCLWKLTSHICLSTFKKKKTICKPYAVVTSMKCKLITSLDAIL